VRAASVPGVRDVSLQVGVMSPVERRELTSGCAAGARPARCRSDTDRSLESSP
jgi:hypothetical protein